jgi:serine protease AprX
MVYEDYPHGMNVLSCMGGNIPGQLVGTAPKAKYWLLRTEDAATEKIIEEMNWLRGAEFADSVGADIINSSLGYNYFDNTADSHTYADMDGHTTIISKAAELAADKGILVVSAAGNAAGYPWYKITAPADADSILTVGAVDSAGFIAGFSSRGLTYDGRIKPDVVARGVQAITAADAGGINAENGTSFASPITAGAVACLWQANPTATNMQLINAIRQSANQFSTPDSIKGYGIPNFCAAHTILTGIDNPNVNTDELMVYPNPFKDNITIVFYSNKKQVIIVSLYDVTGKEIFKQEKNVDANANNTISIAGNKALSNGTYILHLTTPDKSYYKKLNKN